MNYYNPNMYPNFQYGGNTQFFNPYSQNQQQNQVMSLNGKVVDTIDMAKVTEVPIGGYGIFPKADLSEIYVKTWNQNGTTNMLTFKPVLSEEAEPAQNNGNAAIAEILQRMGILESKIDSFINRKEDAASTLQSAVKPVPATKLKKEFNLDDY